MNQSLPNNSIRNWLALLKPGDVVVVGLGICFCVYSALSLWHEGVPDGVIVRAQGKVYAAFDLSHARMLEVPGPLGLTHIEIEPGRVRVASDPGPHQYCVKQGWLSRPGAMAICAPNEVSILLTGGKMDYDSLSY